MKAFVINLDSRPDRLEEFKKNNLPFAVERFSGVVADCGENGCTNSHLTLLRKHKHETPFVIFEDDCMLLQPWSVIESAMKQLPKDWDALWLGATVRTPLKRYSENLFRLRMGYATHAIIYNSERMIDYILKRHNTPSGINLDVFYSRVLQQQYNCFIMYPLAATQRKSYSDISKQEVDFTEYIESSYKKFVQ